MTDMIEIKSRKIIKNEKKAQTINNNINYNSDDKNGVFLYIRLSYDTEIISFDEIIDSVEYNLENRGRIKKIYFDLKKKGIYVQFEPNTWEINFNDNLDRIKDKSIIDLKTMKSKGGNKSTFYTSDNTSFSGSIFINSQDRYYNKKNTVLCTYYQRGKCRNGSNCSFLHIKKEKKSQVKKNQEKKSQVKKNQEKKSQVKKNQEKKSQVKDNNEQLYGQKLYDSITITDDDMLLLKTSWENPKCKITGMLLEMDEKEIKELLENNDKLTEKINEAIQVLMDYTITKENSLNNISDDEKELSSKDIIINKLKEELSSKDIIINKLKKELSSKDIIINKLEKKLSSFRELLDS